MNKIFVTGSTGFVGKHLISALKKRGLSFIAGDRALYGDLVTQKNWEEFLAGCDSVVHLAARVHVMDETSADPLAQFRLSNVESTLNIARAAKKIGVKRFLFISSVKVNGEETFDRPFSASDVPAPQDPYGISKMEAEKKLMELHQPGVFEVVIIRPPLVYGPGVKANFQKLMWLVQKDLPLPFGRVDNRRSLVSVFNLADLIIVCLEHPKAGGEIFLVSDDDDLSLKDLLIKMGKVTNKHPHLLPVPVGMMSFGAKLLGKKSYADRLFGNLQVDIEKTKQFLDWRPPCSFEETFKS
ncbi:MAG: UDP-glucose 4-epimerase family protein [Bacteriovorax sp.]